MSGQHTPAPWEWDGNVCKYNPDDEAPWLTANSGLTPILTGMIRCDNPANACLIAAAPELLHALQQLLAKVECGTALECLLCEAARAAIAKAEGRS